MHYSTYEILDGWAESHGRERSSIAQLGVDGASHKGARTEEIHAAGVILGDLVEEQ